MSVTRAITLAIGLLFGGFGLRRLFDIIKVMRACTETTEGVLVDNKAENWDSSTEYAPIFKYSVNGKEYFRIPSNRITAIRPIIGAKTTIFYNPNNPEQCYARGYNVHILLGIGGVICIIVGILLIAFGLSNLVVFN